jgi:uncharacterized protein (DUF427 family)
MSERRHLVPDASHPITVKPNPKRVVVRAGDTVIADTHAALTLTEASYPPVQYIPRSDVMMEKLAASDHATHCPYKGDASYFDVPELGARGRNAVWSYEAPHEAVGGIGGHLAFYPDRLAIEVLDG